jgi:hypothetical protein
MLPYAVFHQHKHEEESHCEAANSEAENNPCHVSIYHAKDIHRTHCAHAKHIHEETIDCEVCRFLSSHVSQFTLDEPIVSEPISQFVSYISVTASCDFFVFPNLIFSRGPPAIIS